MKTDGGPQTYFSLAGKVAIVTGSTQGLGADIARVLSHSGVSVVIVGRNEEAGNALVHELQQRHGGSTAQAIYSACDIQQDADIDACIAQTVAAFGQIDILVNNACIYDDDGV